MGFRLLVAYLVGLAGIAAGVAYFVIPIGALIYPASTSHDPQARLFALLGAVVFLLAFITALLWAILRALERIGGTRRE